MNGLNILLEDRDCQTEEKFDGLLNWTNFLKDKLIKFTLGEINNLNSSLYMKDI